MNLYDILGINKNASKEEIRKAYRKEAAKAHPDKEGGDNERMQNVNQAYAVLIDDQKREQYDQTGKVDPQSKVDKVKNMFIQVMTEALKSDESVDYIKKCHSILNYGTKETQTHIKALQQQIRFAERKRKKIIKKKKEGENIPRMILDTQMEQFQNQIRELKDQQETIDKTKEMLDDYECLSEEEKSETLANDIYYTDLRGAEI